MAKKQIDKLYAVGTLILMLMLWGGFLYLQGCSTKPVYRALEHMRPQVIIVEMDDGHVYETTVLTAFTKHKTEECYKCVRHRIIGESEGTTSSTAP